MDKGEAYRRKWPNYRTHCPPLCLCLSHSPSNTLSLSPSISTPLIHSPSLSHTLVMYGSYYSLTTTTQRDCYFLWDRFISFVISLPRERKNRSNKLLLLLIFTSCTDLTCSNSLYWVFACLFLSFNSFPTIYLKFLVLFRSYHTYSYKYTHKKYRQHRQREGEGEGEGRGIMVDDSLWHDFSSKVIIVLSARTSDRWEKELMRNNQN